MYNILIEFCILMKMVRLIEMCLNGTYSRDRIDNNLFSMFPIRSGVKQRDGLPPLFFNFALEYSIRRVQVNQNGWKLPGTHQRLVYTDDANILGGNVHIIKENTKFVV